MFRFRNCCTPIALSSRSGGIAAGKKRAVQGKGAVYPFGGHRVGRTASVAGRYRPDRAADAPFSAPDRRLRPFWLFRSLICHTYGRRSGERHTHEVGGQIPYPYISNQDYSDIQVVSYPGGHVPAARQEPPIGYRLRRCGSCFFRVPRYDRYAALPQAKRDTEGKKRVPRRRAVSRQIAW